jgi:NAD(P)-dependent dehydrogenase (short-subunit alcohol dehydrogenase family)
VSGIDSLFQLKDKVIVITGAHGQLGRNFSQAFLSAGAKVIGLDLPTNQAGLDNVEYLNCNILNENEILNAFIYIKEKYRNAHTLINNAGVSTFEPFMERPEEKFDFVMDVNLKGTFLCIRNFVKIFDDLKIPKSIINIASMYGLISPDPRIYTDCGRNSPEIYGATKAGVIQMTKYFAVHLAQSNIRVNAISPGGILNPEQPQGEDFQNNYSYRCPMKRMAKADEMCGAAIYLASATSTYTNGTNIIIDGGMSCW